MVVMIHNKSTVRKKKNQIVSLSCSRSFLPSNPQSFHLSSHTIIYSSIRLSKNPSILLSIYPSIQPANHQFFYASIHPFNHQSFHLSIHTIIYSSNYQSIYVCINVQLTLEQSGFQLCESTYMQIIFNSKYDSTT